MAKLGASSRFGSASEHHPIRERIATVAIWSAAGVVCLSFGLLAFDLLWQGMGHLDFSFLYEMPRDAGRAGGIAPILVSTLLIVGVSMVTMLPIGLGTAILLSEFTGSHRFGKWVRRSLDALAAVPSIVFGLFGNALFCIYLGMGFSILSGGLTLACMALPIFIRTAEEGFRSVPDEYRRAAAALGLSRTTTLWRVLLPAATPALIVGFVLGIGRAMAETAALIFTSGYVDRMPGSLFDSGRAMSVHIYDLAMNVPGGDQHAYATALILLILLLIINVIANVIHQSFTPTPITKR